MIRFATCSLLIAAVMIGFVSAQPTTLSIAGETKYKPHSLVRLKAEGVDPRAGVLWRVYPSVGVQRATNPKGVLEFAAPPGVYEVELLAITNSEEQGIQVQEARVTVTIEAGSAPIPPPGPTPPVPPKPKTPASEAIGRIQFASAGCTATVIYPRRADGRWDVLTAAHCCNPGTSGTMSLKNGKRFGVQVVGHHKTQDIAWLVTTDVHEDLPYAMLAPSNPAAGVKIWHMGYGVDKPGNREEGSVVSPENGDGQTQFRLSVSSGDSGGSILRQDTDEVVSTVCCTSAKGQLANVWGGSCSQIRRTRPAYASDEWTPLEIPIRPEGAEHGCDLPDWTPMPMPLRSAKGLTFFGR